MLIKRSTLNVIMKNNHLYNKCTSYCSYSDPKVHVQNCHHLTSVVCRPYVNFNIFDISKTTAVILAKLDVTKNRNFLKMVITLIFLIGMYGSYDFRFHPNAVIRG
jgi:hypothetical protein